MYPGMHDRGSGSKKEQTHARYLQAPATQATDVSSRNL